MAKLNTKVKLYLEANSKIWEDEKPNLSLQNNSDGAGPFIASWNVSGLAEPTAEQLATYESAATTEENNNITRGIRRNAYGDIGDQLDLIYKDIVAGKLDTSGEWAKKVKAVKDANEKE